jgi:osmotically inducible lipoprotein OsmB
MRKIFAIGFAAMFVTSISLTPAHAGERTITGAAIGAGAGALVLGPVGAVVGGGIGAFVGGPRLTRASGHKRCWHDSAGVRHCHWR